MDEVEKQGHDAIAEAVRSCGSENVMVIEQTRMFGDILHSTLVVRHYRATTNRKIVWVISKRYVDSFKYFTLDELGPHAIASMPDLPQWPADGKYRIAWVYTARKLPGVVDALGVGVHPWGENCNGDIVTAILFNGGIRSANTLAVPRRPWLPIVDDDRNWRRVHVKEKTYVALEYCSYSLGASSTEYYERLVRGIKAPVVALAGLNDPKINGAIDGRGTTYREAKAIIEDSVVFVGCGSGLSCLAASIHPGPHVVEIAGDAQTMPYIGYRKKGDRHVNMGGIQAEEIYETINRILVAQGIRLEVQNIGHAPSISMTTKPKTAKSKTAKSKIIKTKIAVRLRPTVVRTRKSSSSRSR